MADGGRHKIFVFIWTHLKSGMKLKKLFFFLMWLWRFPFRRWEFQQDMTYKENDSLCFVCFVLLSHRSRKLSGFFSVFSRLLLQPKSHISQVSLLKALSYLPPTFCKDAFRTCLPLSCHSSLHFPDPRSFAPQSPRSFQTCHTRRVQPSVCGLTSWELLLTIIHERLEKSSRKGRKIRYTGMQENGRRWDTGRESPGAGGTD